MANRIFRGFAPFRGGRLLWVTNDPAGQVAREGFFGPDASASSIATASGTLPLTGSADADAQAKAQASGTLPLTGSADADAQAKAQASGTLPLTGSADADAQAKAQASGTLPLTGSADADAQAKAQATGTIPLTGSATATAGTAGASAEATGTLPLTGSAEADAPAKAQATGTLPLTGTVIALVITPAIPPYNWAPPLNLASSAIIGQALRFMALAPIPRHDPGSELLPALHDAFEQSIDDLLAAADWSFASTLAVLPGATQPATVTPDENLTTTTRLPGDLIRVQQVWPQGARWRIDGRALLIDQPAPVTIRYTARVTREEVLPATFRTAVALHIALRLSGRWAGSGAAPDLIEIQARTVLKQAMREDSRQATEAPWAERSGLVYGGEADWALEAVA